MWLDKDINHNTIDELRDKAHLRTVVYQQKVAKHYNKNIRVRTFMVRDWALRQVIQNTKEMGACKLGPTWERSYKITNVVG